MNGKLFTLVVVVACTLCISVALAGQGAASGQQSGGSTQGEVQGNDSGKQGGTKDAVQVQSREHAHEQDRNCTINQQEPQSKEQALVQERNREEYPYYETKDGERLEWKHRYTKKMRSYADEADEEAMLRYLHRICEREGIEDSNEIAGFSKWALEQKPWRE
jgi:hypothetical protein